MLTQCCKCYAIRTQGHWFDLGLCAPIRASHTYCPRCMVEVDRQIQDLKFHQEHLRPDGTLVQAKVSNTGSYENANEAELEIEFG